MKIPVIEKMLKACEEARKKSNESIVADPELCPIGDGCCPECNYFGAYIDHIRFNECLG